MTSFMSTMYPLFTKPFVLITFGTDSAQPMLYPEFIDHRLTKILHYLGHNPRPGWEKVGGGFEPYPLGLNPRSRMIYSTIVQARHWHSPEGVCWVPRPNTTFEMFVSFSLHGNSIQKHVRDTRHEAYRCGCESNLSEVTDVLCADKWSSSLLIDEVNPEKEFENTIKLAKMSRFGLAPRGVGNDCYRVWEYLLLGLVPIVIRQQGMEALYEDLPILQLDSWCADGSLLDKARAFAAAPAFQSAKFCGYRRLFLKYWRERLLTITNRTSDMFISPSGARMRRVTEYRVNK